MNSSLHTVQNSIEHFNSIENDLKEIRTIQLSGRLMDNNGSSIQNRDKNDVLLTEEKKLN